MFKEIGGSWSELGGTEDIVSEVVELIEAPPDFWTKCMVVSLLIPYSYKVLVSIKAFPFNISLWLLIEIEARGCNFSLRLRTVSELFRWIVYIWPPLSDLIFTWISKTKYRILFEFLFRL